MNAYSQLMCLTNQWLNSFLWEVTLGLWIHWT